MNFEINVEEIRDFNSISNMVNYINTPEDFRKFIGVWARGVRSNYYSQSLQSLKLLGHIIQGYTRLFTSMNKSGEYKDEFEKMKEYVWGLLSTKEINDNDFYNEFKDAVYTAIFERSIDPRWFRETNAYESVSDELFEYCLEDGEIGDRLTDPFWNIAHRIHEFKSKEDRDKSWKFGEYLVEMIEKEIVDHVKGKY